MESIKLSTMFTLDKAELNHGDIFLWQSGLTGQYSFHKFHSDLGYGIKTYTKYNEVDGSSLVVNHSGYLGKVVITEDHL